MNQDILPYIQNKYLKQLLLDKDKVPALETIIDREAAERSRIEEALRNGTASFGHHPERPEWYLPEIKRQVDTFLDVTDVSKPLCRYTYFNSFVSSMISGTVAAMGGHLAANVDVISGVCFLELAIIFSIFTGYGAHYNTFTRKIILERTSRETLVPTLAHEYAHHVQRTQDLPINSEYDVFREGHARGVQRYIARYFAEAESNPAFLYQITDWTVAELKAVYYWMCKKLGVKPSSAIMNIPRSKDHSERLFFSGPHPYGNAFFSLYEETRGKDIYKSVLKGNLPWKNP